MKHKAGPEGLFLTGLSYDMLIDNDNYKETYEFNR